MPGRKPRKPEAQGQEEVQGESEGHSERQGPSRARSGVFALQTLAVQRPCMAGTAANEANDFAEEFCGAIIEGETHVKAIESV